MNTYEGIGTKRVVKQCARNLPVTWFLTAMEKPLYRQLSTCAATSNKACKFPYYLRVCSNIQFSGIRLHSGVLELFNTEYFRNSPGISEVSFKIFAPVVVSRAPTDATRPTYCCQLMPLLTANAKWQRRVKAETTLFCAGSVYTSKQYCLTNAILCV